MRSFFQDIFQTRYREATASAIVFAIVIGVVMNAAITYAGLKIGFTIGGSAIAAVLGFGVLRGVLRRGSILETNIAQTCASAVNISNSGIIFTVPVLFLLGLPLAADSGDFWLITLAAVGGAILGTAFIIPLRKQMIEIDRLRFPTGTGVAAILKSPGAGPRKAVVLLGGIAAGAAVYWFVAAEQLGFASYGSLGIEVLAADALDAGRLLSFPPQLELIFGIAPFALGAGYITGRPGLFVLAGGILAYHVLTPLAFSMGWMPQSVAAHEAPAYGFSAFNRPLGIGLLLGGAMMGIVMSLPAIREALKSVAAAGRVQGGGDELGVRVLATAAVLAGVLLFAAAYVVGEKPFNRTCPVTGQWVGPVSVADITGDMPEDERRAAVRSLNAEVDALLTATRAHGGYVIRFSSEQAARTWDGYDTAGKDGWLLSNNARPGWLAGFPPLLRAATIALVGVAWIWLAGIIIAQCTGMTDWSPISGMALLTVVLVMLLGGTGAVVGAVLIGAALCVAITLAADMMGDLRTGHLVGAQPKRQQVLELLVVGLGPAVSMLVVLLIAEANRQSFGVPFGPGTPTTAPQAQALQAVITGVQGGEMPYALYGFGALLGALLGLGTFSGLGVLVGLSMYLPFAAIATYGVGCVINMLVARWKGRIWAEDWGVPFAAGLIVGESLLAMTVNMIVLATG